MKYLDLKKTHKALSIYSSIIHTVKWKQTKWPSAAESINKTWCVEYYLAIKRGEIPTCVP